MSGSAGNLGDDNPYPMGVMNGKDVFLTRYWDCAKQSCGWPDKGQVASCNKDNGKLGVTSEQSGASGGNAYTCFGMRPWAHSNVLSYGYMATPVQGISCGKCYLVQFTGEGNSNRADPGSQALKGKMMVVMATNIGGDVSMNQFDLLIPGGGVGQVNACGNQKVAAPMTIYGGYAADCKNDKTCVKQKCDAAFGDSKFADLKAGCDWFIDWYNVADNPKAKYQEVSCPKELVDHSK
jgi:Glycosyl hydrolase family 45